MIFIIYALKNKCNDKIYIGQTFDLKQRWNNGHGYIGCHKIHNAILKLGKENFYYEKLAFCETEKIANIIETFLIEKFDTINNGYNITNGGRNCGMIGLKHKPESIKKMSESHKGNTAHLGKKHSEETKKILSEKTKKQFAEKGYPFLNKKHSLETKEKIKIKSLGKRKSINTEFKPKISIKIIENIKLDHLNGIKNKDICKKYNISSSYVSLVVNNKRRKNQ